MEGTRHSVTSADGVRIGLLTAGSGPALLLVHGGMAQATTRSRPNSSCRSALLFHLFRRAAKEAISFPRNALKR
jgi:hypothetical protein